MGEPMTEAEARERILAKLQDTPQNRTVNLLVNLHRMTHRNAWNLLRLLAKSEDFIVGLFGDPETMLRAWRRAKKQPK